MAVAVMFIGTAVGCGNTKLPGTAGNTVEMGSIADAGKETMTLPEFKIYDNKEIPEDVEVLMDIEYGKGGDTPLKLNLIRPKKQPAKPMPVIMWIHGGSWIGGNKDAQTGKLAGYAQQGYFCASIQYRFSDVAIFPAQLEDCKCAVRFLRMKAKEYNIDPNKIGVWGGSAGGHLAALLGTTVGIKELEGHGGWQEYSSKVQAVCDWFGPAQFVGAKLSPDHVVSKMMGGTPQENPDKARNASPITYVTKDDAPILIMHGDKDNTTPLVLSQMFYNSLKKEGVDATLYIVKDAGHGFMNLREYKMVLQFFDKQFR